MNVIDYIDFPARIISSIIGGIIVIFTGIGQLEKYQENWILYRTTKELLKKEKYFFENNAGEYAQLNDDEKSRMLVDRVESIVSTENFRYFIIHRTIKMEENGNSKN